MRKITSLVVVCVVAVAPSAVAGSYLEPPGPPGSEAAKMRTLNEIQPASPIHSLPFVITNSGKYVLVEDLTGTNGQDGISIQADNVTVDLNGFTLTGVSGSLYGINIPAKQTSITIMNGVIRNWGLYGVFASLVENSKYMGLTSISNGWGANCSGIYVGKNSEVSDCISAGSKSIGISVQDSSVVRNCKVYGNGGRGIDAKNGSTVIGCSSYGNSSDGIGAYHGSTITRCTAYNNAFRGFSIMDGCTISDCTAYANTNIGFSVGSGVTITKCSASGNGSDGIYGGGGCIISKCAAYRNTGDGIQVSYDTYVTGNSCSANGYGTGDGAGIHVTSARNRIQENNVTSNDRGIDVDGASNLIVRNVANGNTVNFDIAGSNQTGTIQSSPVGAGAWDNFSL